MSGLPHFSDTEDAKARAEVFRRDMNTPSYRRSLETPQNY